MSGQNYKRSKGDDVSPPRNHFPITPADDVDLPNIIRELFVGNGGDVRLRMIGSSTVCLYENLPDGFLLSGFFDQVWSAGTTATGLIGRH